MKLSIITINLNNRSGLSKTIDSVISQDFSEFEYIVIDGASTDGSVDYIKKNQAKISDWVSEADSGIYNAMNKGIKKANGEYLLFLNSGDFLLEPTVLSAVFKNELYADITACDATRLNQKNVIEDYIQPDQVDAQFFYKYSLCHQSLFYKKSLFDTLGVYNEELKIVSDWEFNLKALIFHKCTYQHLSISLSYFDISGESSKNLIEMNAERKKVLEALFTTKQLEGFEKKHQYNHTLIGKMRRKIMNIF